MSGVILPLENNVNWFLFPIKKTDLFFISLFTNSFYLYLLIFFTINQCDGEKKGIHSKEAPTWQVIFTSGRSKSLSMTFFESSLSKACMCMILGVKYRDSHAGKHSANICASALFYFIFIFLHFCLKFSLSSLGCFGLIL